MKDLFSDSSALYQQARPTYPHSVIDEILKYVPTRQFAWDCASGSGQFTQLLVPYFEQIVATDLSSAQLRQAPYFENVSYQVQQAELTSFADQSFDLISVAQAIHWFNFDAFYAEVQRTLKPEGVLAVIGYGLIKTQDAELNRLIQFLYHNVLGEYWDVERKYIDECYKTIPFPFDELATPMLDIRLVWSAEQLLAYLNTWTGLKHYRAAMVVESAVDPLQALQFYLAKNTFELEINFPVFLRIGKLKAHTGKRNYKRQKGKAISILKRASLGLKEFVAA